MLIIYFDIYILYIIFEYSDSSNIHIKRHKNVNWILHCLELYIDENYISSKVGFIKQLRIDVYCVRTRFEQAKTIKRIYLGQCGVSNQWIICYNLCL